MKSAVTPLSLGTDRISSLLVRYAIPSIVAMTSSSLYNIIDSIFIGHGVGALAISGLALTMPLMNLASAFGAMVGIGASAIISIRLGQGNKLSAEQTLGNVVLLNLLIGTLFTVASLMFLDPILYFFGASDQTIGYARDFMRIILSGTIITHMYLGLNEVLRASGYPRKAMLIMLTAVAVNCTLNPLFIFVFGWGIRGSAFATVIAQAVALSVSLTHFSSRESFLHFQRSIFRLRRRIVGGILSIGLAPFLLHMCASVVVIFVNKALKVHGGDLYIGAYGIINRVALLFVMIVAGLNQGMQPIVGYNYGAKEYERVKRIHHTALGLCSIVMLAGMIICLFASELLMGMFTSNPETIQLGALALHIICWGFVVSSISVMTSGTLEGLGKGFPSLVISFLRYIAMIPIACIMSRVFGAVGVWHAFWVTELIAAGSAVFLYKRNIRDSL